MGHVLLRATRVVLHDKSASLDKVAFDVTGLLSFNSMTTMRTVSAVSAMLSRDDAASYLPPLLTEVSQKTTRGSDARRFCIPNHKLAATENCFYYQAAKLWNNLPKKNN